MPDWKKLIEGKIALGKRGLIAGKVYTEDRPIQFLGSARLL